MQNWIELLRYNPVPALLDCKEKAVQLVTRRDLLNEKIPLNELWQNLEAQKILKRQNKDGSWTYPNAKERIRKKENYNQIETYRNLGYLIEQFAYTNKHPSIQCAAEFLFRFQTKEGDFRGIYGNQYTPNYSAGIIELLIKAGYENDNRILKAFNWLLSIRQNDGGWAIPLRTRNANLNVITDNSKLIKPDISKAYSHMVTGVVLRAFAAHPSLRNSKEAIKAGKLLSASLFRKDKYPDRATEDYWLRFTFPFWFTDLISAMDTLSLLSLIKNEPSTDKAIHWFVSKQKQNGMWELKVLKGRNKKITEAWLCLAICRIFKRVRNQQDEKYISKQ